MQQLKTAIIHDYLTQAGGAERVAAALHDLFPSAPIYTSIYDSRATLPEFAQADIRTSFLQNWPVATRRMHKLALSYYPVAFEQFDLNEYDLVLSNTTSFAKGVITAPQTCHICYCHTPSRFAWRQHEYLSQSKTARLLLPLMRGILSNLRAWDVQSAQRVDYFVGGSLNAARRIRKFYRRECAAVIYPPVQTNRFCPVPANQVENYFLVVSRLVGYKRVDLAIDACNHLYLPLRIIGTGPELAALRRKAGPTVQFLGRLPDEQVAQMMARCQALIFPGEEDFGLTPLEAMASGRPVIAYGMGGALETVIEGKTGLFFREQTAEALARAIQASAAVTFHPEALRAHALRFDRTVFDAQMRAFVESAVTDYRQAFDIGDKNTTPDMLDVLAAQQGNTFRLSNGKLSSSK